MTRPLEGRPRSRNAGKVRAQSLLRQNLAICATTQMRAGQETLVQRRDTGNLHCDGRPLGERRATSENPQQKKWGKMIGAVIEQVLLSEVRFDHSVMLALAEGEGKAVLYSSSCSWMSSSAFLKRLAQFRTVCDDFGQLPHESHQAFLPLDALTLERAFEGSRSDLARDHHTDGTATGYAFLVASERKAILFALARSDGDAFFSLDETQRLRRFAPMVWGVLHDCLRLSQNKGPFIQQLPPAPDAVSGHIGQSAEPPGSLAHVLGDFIRTRGVRLSPRELAVASLSLRGESAKTIAAGLGISPHTVAIHLRNIYSKLHVKNRAHLHAVYADFFMAGAGPPSPPSINPLAAESMTHAGTVPQFTQSPWRSVIRSIRTARIALSADAVKP